MKIQNILTASILALSLGGVSQAEEIIHVTGSTAFRSAFVTSVERLMGGSGNFKAAYDNVSGTTEKNSNYSIFSGTISGVATTIKCTWTGSVGGVIANSKQVDIHNVPTNGWVSKTNLPGTNTVVGLASLSYTLDGEVQGNASDVNMSDSQQTSTGFAVPALAVPTIAAADPAVSVAGQVGVIVFDWVANNGSPATITNITNQQAQNLLSGGVFLSTLTGSASDYTTDGSGNPTGAVVYAIGRNFDSGTRLSEFAETGFGVFSLPQQVAVTVNGTVGAAGSTVKNIDLYPTDTLFAGQSFALSYAVGNSGYSSGGTVGKLLATPGSLGKGSATNPPLFESFYGILGGYLVGYLGRSDAATATSSSVFPGNTARVLTFNGVADTDVNVQQGLYQGWEYEYMYETTRTGSTALTANQKTVINALYNGILKTDAPASGILIDSMAVSKSLEGGLITHL